MSSPNPKFIRNTSLAVGFVFGGLVQGSTFLVMKALNPQLRQYAQESTPTTAATSLGLVLAHAAVSFGVLELLVMGILKYAGIQPVEEEEDESQSLSQCKSEDTVDKIDEKKKKKEAETKAANEMVAMQEEEVESQVTNAALLGIFSVMASTFVWFYCVSRSISHSHYFGALSFVTLSGLGLWALCRQETAGNKIANEMQTPLLAKI